MDDQTVEIAGAGPAGLAAAITLARAGRRVLVHEAHPHVGFRFRRDLQGLENWTTSQDVLAHLNELGLTTRFKALPCRHGTAFDAWDQTYHIRSDSPVFYMVERGPGADTLDSAFFRQARELGVTIRFNSRITTLPGPAIYATGPRGAVAIATGYHFDTPMSDGFWVVCDNELAPGGYAYLLVMGGKGTVKSCMFGGFKQQALYVRRTVAAFERLTGLEMVDPRPHGGVATFHVPYSARYGVHPIAGEQAGFQDVLWGFGMRVAIDSGVLAAQCLLEGCDYDACWQQTLRASMKSSQVNRKVYGRFGNKGYRWMLRYLAGHPDVLSVLRGQYAPSRLKSLLSPLAQVMPH